MKNFLALGCLALFISTHSFSQIRKIPVSVTDAFARQYPQAKEVSYKDALTTINISFTEDGVAMIARYTNKGEWKQTEADYSFDRLPQEVKDGFSKSKYAGEWMEEGTSIIYFPDNAAQYRVKVGKNDLQKKYLFFDKSGKLLRDAITI